MARHEKRVTIATPGRDAGKTYLIQEMPAYQGEKWAYRALLALSRGGIELPPGIFDAGFSGLAAMMPYFLVIGLRSLHGAQWVELEPLMDEMMTCVQWCPPGNAPLQPYMAGAEHQVSEIATLQKLRLEVLQLHVNFSIADALQTTESSPQAPASN